MPVLTTRPSVTSPPDHDSTFRQVEIQGNCCTVSDGPNPEVKMTTSFADLPSVVVKPGISPGTLIHAEIPGEGKLAFCDKVL